MADHHHEEEKKDESFVEKMDNEIHGHDPSSLFGSEDENRPSIKAKVYRLFGREKPVHRVLGGGKPADVLLWRNKKESAGVLGMATVAWFLLDVLECHLITVVCNGLILVLALVFLWSHVNTFVQKASPRIPEIRIPEDPVLDIASALRIQINQAFAVLRDIVSRRDMKKFIVVIAGLWVVSKIGSWFDFWALLYTITLLLFTIPMLYEKYEDEVDSHAEKVLSELKNLCAEFDASVLSQIPKGPLKDKKRE